MGTRPPVPPWQAGQLEGAAEVVAVDEQPGVRYRIRAPHPLAQLATRIGLWSAVALGAVGGIVGLVRPPVQQVEALADGGGVDQGSVPAPVAGTAELVVEAWLTAGDEDDDALDALFLDPPSRDETHQVALTIEHLATVAGEQRAAGYWAVTVAVDVMEEIAVEGESPEDQQTIEQLRATWYMEVAIVGDVDGRLLALTAPSVVPPPDGAVADWRASVEPLREADDGVLAETVEGFLGALLADGGDPSRYLAPGGEIEAMDPAPFIEVELVAMTAEDYEGGQTRVLAEIVATTPGGTRTRLTYELMLGEWADRWEITRFSGAPSVVVAPAPEDDAEESDDAEDDAGTDGDGEDDPGTGPAEGDPDGGEDGEDDAGEPGGTGGAEPGATEPGGAGGDAPTGTTATTASTATTAVVVQL